MLKIQGDGEHELAASSAVFFHRLHYGVGIVCVCLCVCVCVCLCVRACVCVRAC